MRTDPTPLSSDLRARCGVAAIAVVASVIATAAAHAQAARDYISVVGSSTVYPFATVVAERFGRSSAVFKAPKIESTGSGGGIRLFCSGVGIEHPDVANSSRRIRASELALCDENGVADVVEVKIGYDGIVLANSNAAPAYALTRAQIFLALAKNVPDPSGGGDLVENPYRRWSQIDASLPSVDIEVLGPPPTSGTRDAFVELVMDVGCEAFAVIEQLDGEARQLVCQTLREDGAFIEAGENDNLIVQKLETNPDALGIFGYSFLDQNYDKVQGSAIDGVVPEFEAIADGSYPIARPLYFYLKRAHVDVIPGIREYLREFTSDAAIGEFGYLTDRGLIPLPESERVEVLSTVENMTPLHLK